MPRILGIDPSLTSTGLAVVDVDGGETDIRLVTVSSKPTKDKSYSTLSTRIGSIVDQIEKVTLNGVTHAVIEGPSFGSIGSHQHTRAWLWGRVFDMVSALQIPMLVVTPSQRMKYATGRGNAGKDIVLAAAIRRWPEAEITGNDTADALILAAIAARHLGQPIDSVPLSHHGAVMGKIAT